MPVICVKWVSTLDYLPNWSYLAIVCWISRFRCKHSYMRTVDHKSFFITRLALSTRGRLLKKKYSCELYFVWLYFIIYFDGCDVYWLYCNENLIFNIFSGGCFFQLTSLLKSFTSRRFALHIFILTIKFCLFDNCTRENSITK